MANILVPLNIAMNNKDVIYILTEGLVLKFSSLELKDLLFADILLTLSIVV